VGLPRIQFIATARMRILKSFLLILLQSWIVHHTVAQAQTPKDSIQQWYDQQMGLDHIGLIEGTYFPIHYTKDNSHQFYKEKTWSLGTISINGQIFHEVSLMYEIHHDVLLMRHPTDFLYSGQAIQLPLEKIDYFNLHNADFINNRRNVNGFPKGYYQMLYQGQLVQVLAKRQKMKIVGKTVEYTPDDQLFIALDSIYIVAKNRKSITDHWPEWKDEIRTQTRQHQLRLNRSNETDWVSIAHFLDQRLQISQNSEE
jgi:hypothetical protein